MPAEEIGEGVHEWVEVDGTIPADRQVGVDTEAT